MSPTVHALPIKCQSSHHYTPRISALMGNIGKEMGTDIRAFSLQIQLRGGRRHPTLHDCKIVTTEGPGHMRTNSLNALSQYGQDDAAALAYRIAGDGGIVGGMVRSSMTRPIYQCMPQGVIVYDEDDLRLPPAEPALERAETFTRRVFAYQARSGAHQRLLFQEELNRFMPALISPPEGIDLCYTLTK